MIMTNSNKNLSPSSLNTQGKAKGASLRLVAWEVTRKCNLNCVHCRAGSERGPYPGELDTDKCLDILEQIRRVGKPIVILTGGEPILREDIFDLAERGTQLGLRMVMATNGTLFTPQIIESMKASGIMRVSISIDGSNEVSMISFERSLAPLRQPWMESGCSEKPGLSFRSIPLSPGIMCRISRIFWI